MKGIWIIPGFLIAISGIALFVSSLLSISSTDHNPADQRILGFPVFGLAFGLVFLGMVIAGRGGVIGFSRRRSELRGRLGRCWP